MKDFDIEQLERKNIYKTPDDFFGQMQANVLLQASPPKPIRNLKVNWMYAAAAAVAMIFGLTFFVNQDQTETEIIADTSQPSSVEIFETPQPALSPKNEATVAYQILSADLTSASANNQKADEAIRVSEPKAKTVSAELPGKPILNPEVQVDQILANITSAELADLGKNAEQDVYLDLYY